MPGVPGGGETFPLVRRRPVVLPPTIGGPMRRSLALVGGLLVSISAAQAFHPWKYDGTCESWLDRYVQRAPCPRRPVDHMSMERAGYPQSVRAHAVPSVGENYNSGYVGGRRVLHNNLCGRGPGSATGPITEGVYATDWTGFREHMGRVFLAPSPDPSKGRYWYRGYLPEGPRVTDVFAIRPLRKAILEKHEDMEKRHGHGEEGHGGHEEGGHGEGGHGEAGHGAEGGAKKEGH